MVSHPKINLYITDRSGKTALDLAGDELESLLRVETRGIPNLDAHLFSIDIYERIVTILKKAIEKIEKGAGESSFYSII